MTRSTPIGRVKSACGLAMLDAMKKWMGTTAVCLAALTLAACAATGRSVVVQPNDRVVVARPAPSAVASGGSYKVVRGDTLYSIAFRHGLDFRDLAAINHIAPPYRIWPGQALRLSASRAPTQPSVATTTARPDRRPLPAAKPPMPVVAHVPPARTPPTPIQAPAAPPVQPPPKGATHDAGGVVWRWPADGKLIKKFKSGDAIPGIELAGNAGDPVRAAADGVVVYSGNGLVGYGELVIIKHNDSFLSAYGHNRKRLVKEGERVSAGQVIAEMGSTGASRDELQFQIRRDGNPVDPLDYLPAR